VIDETSDADFLGLKRFTAGSAVLKNIHEWFCLGSGTASYTALRVPIWISWRRPQSRNDPDFQHSRPYLLRRPAPPTESRDMFCALARVETTRPPAQIGWRLVAWRARCYVRIMRQ
jgi:hypothetical protein